MYSVYASAKSGKCTYLQPTENTSKQACFVPVKSWISIVPETGNDK